MNGRNMLQSIHVVFVVNNFPKWGFLTHFACFIVPYAEPDDEEKKIETSWF